MYTSEHVLAKYPILPAQVCDSIVKSFIGQSSLASIGKNFGVQFVMRSKVWFSFTQDKAHTEEPAPYKVANALKKTKTDATPPAVTSWVVESLVGLIYQEMGAKEAREFISKHVLSRAVDTEAHYNNYLKMRAPKLILSKLLRVQGKPAAVARLLKESGRTSSTPVFIVGIYSGTEKIGESYGSSLKMAEVKVFFNLIVGC